MDWNLRTCGRHGHVTYAPDEPGLRARLQAETPVGTAWRCLRCGDWVVGEPAGAGPADQAPEVPRGRMLRDRTIMRALAVERAARGTLLLLLALLVFRFREARTGLQAAFEADLPLLRPLADQLGWDVDHSWLVRTARDVFTLSATTLAWIAVGLLAYAALQYTEAVGLWLVRRWGEYFAVVATSVFLPLEVFELTEHVTLLRLGAFAVNVAAVVWLVWSKRLFGVRGGAVAYHAEHAAESLLTVERAAAEVPVPETARH